MKLLLYISFTYYLILQVTQASNSTSSSTTSKPNDANKNYNPQIPHYQIANDQGGATNAAFPILSKIAKRERSSVDYHRPLEIDRTSSGLTPQLQKLLEGSINKRETTLENENDSTKKVQSKKKISAKATKFGSNAYKQGGYTGSPDAQTATIKNYLGTMTKTGGKGSSRNQFGGYGTNLGQQYLGNDGNLNNWNSHQENNYQSTGNNNGYDLEGFSQHSHVASSSFGTPTNVMNQGPNDMNSMNSGIGSGMDNYASSMSNNMQSQWGDNNAGNSFTGSGMSGTNNYEVSNGGNDFNYNQQQNTGNLGSSFVANNNFNGMGYNSNNFEVITNNNGDFTENGFNNNNYNGFWDNQGVMNNYANIQGPSNLGVTDYSNLNGMSNTVSTPTDYSNTQSNNLGVDYSSMSNAYNNNGNFVSSTASNIGSTNYNFPNSYVNTNNNAYSSNIDYTKVLGITPNTQSFSSNGFSNFNSNSGNSFSTGMSNINFGPTGNSGYNVNTMPSTNGGFNNMATSMTNNGYDTNQNGIINNNIGSNINNGGFNTVDNNNNAGSFSSIGGNSNGNDYNSMNFASSTGSSNINGNVDYMSQMGSQQSIYTSQLQNGFNAIGGISQGYGPSNSQIGSQPTTQGQQEYETNFAQSQMGVQPSPQPNYEVMQGQHGGLGYSMGNNVAISSSSAYGPNQPGYNNPTQSYLNVANNIAQQQTFNKQPVYTSQYNGILPHAPRFSSFGSSTHSGRNSKSNTYNVIAPMPKASTSAPKTSNLPPPATTYKHGHNVYTTSYTELDSVGGFTGNQKIGDAYSDNYGGNSVASNIYLSKPKPAAATE